ncbi:hypothetical protein DAPPUDRAFT_223010 [Daphnia pulex]|uniref:ATP-dependent RNA helicase n=1 Tax=Daphnia pulex TaxID=6669 RepID=E9G7U6_DAPPU|nr:hypothetical protein DAPPUDRAFT_223010 [Daphnia pulex]|eukprot:EFX84542.1 hypothetical protein DAPPUDRAFT_223010 [Daphnia pulex]
MESGSTNVNAKTPDDNKQNGPGSQKTKKKNNSKAKLHPSRVKASAIEQHEIKNLQIRYTSVETSAVLKFKDIPLSKKTLQGLQQNEYTTPTEVQKESIVLALRGLDVLGAAKTGSGKTLAFVIPVLERLYCMQWTRLDGLGALIITPTRELAYQIFETFRKVGIQHDFSAGLIIGGKDLNFERKRLDQCNIMICTPGRVLHHMDENPLFDCSNLQILVIDEADRCLDLGFQQTMNGIIENLPPKRQTLLFSATQTKSVKDLARLSLKDPVYVSVHENAQYSTPESLRQSYIITPIQNKVDILWSFLRSHRKKKLIVFLTSCKQVRFIHQAFTRLRPGLSVLALYGTMHQMKRMSVYEEFCEKQTAVLFATDIAARGLDFPNVDWVIQMDCPDDPSSYIHRAGRTARYQKGGESLLMLLPSEEAMVEQLAQKKIPIQKIEVNPSKLVSIQRKLEAMLARDVELKQMAQRAFVTYAKSVFLMKDKSIFDVTSIDLNALARSLGLALAPRVRFLQKHLKATESAAPPQAPRMLKPNYDTPVEKPIAAQSTEQQWRRNDLEAAYDFHAEDELQDSDSDDGIFKIKRQNHALPGFEEAEEEEVEIGVEKKKKEKILTKEKVAKRILAKKLKANKIVNFDDEGNRIYDASREKVSELGRALEIEASTSITGGINLVEAKKAMEEEDKYDKEIFRQRIKAKHREDRLKAKAERRLANRVEKEEEVTNVEGEEEDEESEGDESVDGSVGEIIDALPDPDRIYGAKEDDNEEEGDVYRGPAVAKKRSRLPSESEEDDDSEDNSESDYDEAPVKPTPITRKRRQPSESEELPTPTKTKQKWIKKKPPKKQKPAKNSKFDTGLDLAMDEELALHILGSKN